MLQLEHFTKTNSYKNRTCSQSLNSKYVKTLEDTRTLAASRGQLLHSALEPSWPWDSNWILCKACKFIQARLKPQTRLPFFGQGRDVNSLDGAASEVPVVENLVSQPSGHQKVGG